MYIMQNVKTRSTAMHVQPVYLSENGEIIILVMGN